MFSRFFSTQFAPPRYLTMPSAGIDISASAVKAITLKKTRKGLVLDKFAEVSLKEGVIVSGEIIEHAAVLEALTTLRKEYGIQNAAITLPEARTYLFEADLVGKNQTEWKTEVEQHLDEYIPLPPAEVQFDAVPVAVINDKTHVVGVGVARRIVDLALSVFDDAGITVTALEDEIFASPRALLPHDNEETVLIIDFGRTTTKLVVVHKRIPVYATTLDIGGHAITLAIQKHLGVTEDEARKIKGERGLVSNDQSDGYIEAVISTVCVIREEIVKRLQYWQGNARVGTAHEPVTRAILAGGNATVRGLPEYFEAALQVPVELGDVFTNLASRDVWLPPIDYTASLAYATSIGLALRSFMPKE